VAASAAAALAAWVVQHAGFFEGGVPVAAALFAGAAAAASAWRWPATRPCQLAWDGTQWLADGQPASVKPMLDIGAGLLMRAGRRWIAVSRADAGAAWHALRVAVHAPVRAGA
jgi:hypothetical protein